MESDTEELLEELEQLQLRAQDQATQIEREQHLLLQLKIELSSLESARVDQNKQADDFALSGLKKLRQLEREEFKLRRDCADLQKAIHIAHQQHLHYVREDHNHITITNELLHAIHRHQQQHQHQHQHKHQQQHQPQQHKHIEKDDFEEFDEPAMAHPRATSVPSTPPPKLPARPLAMQTLSQIFEQTISNPEPELDPDSTLSQIQRICDILSILPADKSFEIHPQAVKEISDHVRFIRNDELRLKAVVREIFACLDDAVTHREEALLGIGMETPPAGVTRAPRNSQKAAIRKQLAESEAQLALWIDIAEHLVWEVSQSITVQERQRLAIVEDVAKKRRDAYLALLRLSDLCDEFPNRNS